MFHLHQIAEITSGITLRSSVKGTPAGGVTIIQMRDLGKDNIVNLNSAMRTDCINNPKPHQLVKIGDIIFRSRGQNNTAALVTTYAVHTVTTAPLFRIRAKSGKVIPEFLLWWLNRPSSQAYFSSQSEGTGLQMVSKKSLENLEVVLPPLQQQQQIAEFYKLLTEEQRLAQKIRRQQERYIQSIIMQQHPSRNEETL